MGGALTDGGSLLDWLRGLIGEERFALAEAEAAALLAHPLPSPRGGIPLVLPLWSGERSTGWHSSATGSICGVTRCTSGAHLLLGLLEGVFHRLDAVLARLVQAGCVGSDACIVASGAVLEGSRAYRQLLADVTDRRVCLGPSEATTAGVLQLMCDDLPPRADAEGALAPRPEWAAAYRARALTHEQLYRSLVASTAD